MAQIKKRKKTPDARLLIKLEARPGDLHFHFPSTAEKLPTDISSLKRQEKGVKRLSVEIENGPLINTPHL